MSSTSVSLLMPNRDNGAILEHVLARLAANTTYPEVELIAIDDGSTDGSREALRRWRDSGAFARMELIEREHDQDGVVGALNQGLARCSGELVVQLDADASIETPGWLETMVAFMDSDERIGAATGKVVFDSGLIHTCGVSVLGAEGLHGRGSTVTEPVGRRTYHERVQRLSEDSPCVECDVPAEVDAGAGCCMIYRREVALEVGGYDLGYAPVWFDDTDLTIAIRRHGLKVFYLPDVRVVHHVGAKSADAPPSRRLDATARQALRTMLPARARHRLAAGLRIQPLPDKYWSRIQHHYAYWREKWGWDVLNPDVAEIGRRWAGTELCWRQDADRRAAGEEIVAAFVAGSRLPS